MEKVPLLLLHLSPGASDALNPNISDVNQMFKKKKRREMPQKCHHSTLVTCPSNPLVNMHSFACTCVNMSRSSLFLAFGWQGGSYNPITVVKTPRGPAERGDISGILRLSFTPRASSSRAKTQSAITHVLL